MIFDELILIYLHKICEHFYLIRLKNRIFYADSDPSQCLIKFNIDKPESLIP